MTAYDPTHNPIDYSEIRSPRYERRLTVFTKAYRPDFVIVKAIDWYRSQGSSDEWTLNRIDPYRLTSQDSADAKVRELRANPANPAS